MSLLLLLSFLSILIPFTIPTNNRIAIPIHPSTPSNPQKRRLPSTLEIDQQKNAHPQPPLHPRKSLTQSLFRDPSTLETSSSVLAESSDPSSAGLSSSQAFSTFTPTKTEELEQFKFGEGPASPLSDLTLEEVFTSPPQSPPPFGDDGSLSEEEEEGKPVRPWLKQWMKESGSPPLHKDLVYDFLVSFAFPPFLQRCCPYTARVHFPTLPFSFPALSRYDVGLKNSLNFHTLRILTIEKKIEKRQKELAETNIRDANIHAQTRATDVLISKESTLSPDEYGSITTQKILQWSLAHHQQIHLIRKIEPLYWRILQCSPFIDQEIDDIIASSNILHQMRLSIIAILFLNNDLIYSSLPWITSLSKEMRIICFDRDLNKRLLDSSHLYDFVQGISALLRLALYTFHPFSVQK